MKLPSLMKINSHSRFQFRPRYYNERQERLEQIKAKYANPEDPAAAKDRIKGSFERRIAYERRNSKAVKANYRLLLIIALLAMISYWIIF